MMRPTTVPSASTSNGRRPYSPNGRLAEVRLRTSEDILRGYHISLGGHVSLLVPNLPRQVAQRRSPTRGIQGPSETLPDGDDEAIVHPQELLARPAALQLVAGLARGAHEQTAAVGLQRGTTPPPLVAGRENARK